MDTEQLINRGSIITGSLFNEPMRVEIVNAIGPGTWIIGMVGIHSEKFLKVTLTAAEIAKLSIFNASFDYCGDGKLLCFGIQAYSLGIAYEFDPYFSLSGSHTDIEM